MEMFSTAHPCYNEMWRRVGLFAGSFLLVWGAAGARSTVSDVPKDIYTFWDGGWPLPPLLDRSVATWYRHAADWNIHILNRSTWQEFAGKGMQFGDLEKLQIEAMSDAVRLEVLSEKGGIWLDLTVAMTEPLSEWLLPLLPRGDALFGLESDFELADLRQVDPLREDWETHWFRNGSLRSGLQLEAPRPNLANREPGWTPLFLESWFFAAPPGCTALRLWRDEFRKAVSHPKGLPGYCEELKKQETSKEFLHPALAQWLPYLTVHATLAQIRNANPDVVVVTRRAEAIAFCHFDYTLDWSLTWLQGSTKFSVDGKGGPVFAMARAPFEDPPPPRICPLIKLRNPERPAFDSIGAWMGYHQDSMLARIYDLPRPPRWWPGRVARYFAAWEASHLEWGWAIEPHRQWRMEKFRQWRDRVFFFGKTLETAAYVCFWICTVLAFVYYGGWLGRSPSTFKSAKVGKIED